MKRSDLMQTDKFSEIALQMKIKVHIPKYPKLIMNYNLLYNMRSFAFIDME